MNENFFSEIDNMAAPAVDMAGEIDTTWDLVRESYARMGLTVTTATVTQTAAIVEQLNGGPVHGNNSTELATSLSNLLRQFVDRQDAVRTGRKLALLCLALFPELNNNKAWGSLRSLSVPFGVSHALLSKDMIGIREKFGQLWRGAKRSTTRATYAEAQRRAFRRGSHARFYQRPWEERVAELVRLKEKILSEKGAQEWAPDQLVSYCRKNGFFKKELTAPNGIKSGTIGNPQRQFLGRIIKKSGLGDVTRETRDGRTVMLYHFRPTPSAAVTSEKLFQEARRLVEHLRKKHRDRRWLPRDLMAYARQAGFFKEQFDQLARDPARYDNRAMTFFSRQLSRTRAFRLVRRQVNCRFVFFYEPSHRPRHRPAKTTPVS